jgi:multidrug efflux pump subunit AcrA (membrane-fusion protein)
MNFLKTKIVALKNWLLAHKTASIVGAVVLVIIIIVIATGKKEESAFVVDQRDVRQQVVVSGKVQLTQEVDLGFSANGTIQKVSVTSGQKVSRGQLLAQLDVADLSADRARLSAQLQLAKINSTRNKLELASGQQEYARFTGDVNKELDAAIAAYFSNSLTAIPDNLEARDLVPPVISGAFKNDGSITLDNALNVTPRKYEIEFNRVNGNELGVIVKGAAEGRDIYDNGAPMALANTGLYISVTDINKYFGSSWVMYTPNKTAVDFAQSYNTFVSTITKLKQDSITKQFDARDTELRYGQGWSETDVNLAVAQAQLQAVQAQIDMRTLRAPFAGTVGMVDISVGDTVDTSKAAVTVIGNQDAYLVKLKVPEGSVTKLRPGLPVELVLDAQRDKKFSGSVLSVSPSETYVDGVPVYETVIQFSEADPTIRSGMNVTATIIVQEEKNVLAIPKSAVTFDGEKATVVIAESEKVVPVALGMLGSDEYFHVVSGLNKGDSIVVTK